MIERYENSEIKKIWSSESILTVWLNLEIAVCEAWSIEKKDDDFKKAATELIKNSIPSLNSVKEEEKKTDHDVAAFLNCITRKLPENLQGKVHYGLTSSDILDTTLAILCKESLFYLIHKVCNLALEIDKLKDKCKNLPCVGRTHGIHAIEMTFDHKISNWLEEVHRNYLHLINIKRIVNYGKMSGVVGTYNIDGLKNVSSYVLSKFNLFEERVTTQIIPRDRFARLIFALAILLKGYERIATEIRNLQRTEIDEVEEPFNEKSQQGSSAMPHKRNPIKSEKICGLSRLITGFVVTALDNIPLWHERDITHSCNERIIIADSFHIAAHATELLTKIISGLKIKPENMKKNLLMKKEKIKSQKQFIELLDSGISREEAYRLIQSKNFEKNN